MRFLVSAGEASGDMYAAGIAALLRALYPSAQFYGCAGPRLQAAGVEPVVDAARLGVVGLAEVVEHLPRIYGEYRKLVRYARHYRPDAAVLTDNPDFHLRLARELKQQGVPVYYVVAPQVWAWRQGRVKHIRNVVDRLFCLFPFEERWFQDRGVNATYIGHPLASIVRASATSSDFRAQYGLTARGRIVTLLPGSRTGEALRHLPTLLETVGLLQAGFRQRTEGERSTDGLDFLLAMPPGFTASEAYRRFREPIAARSIQVIENDTWNAIAHSTLALAASGTVTVETALLGTPMVTFYKVNPLSWSIGRRLVRVPNLTMVNLIAGSTIVPELMQDQMNPETLATAAEALLYSPEAREQMRRRLAHVRAALTREGDPLSRVVSFIERDLERSGRAVVVSRETMKV